VQLGGKKRISEGPDLMAKAGVPKKAKPKPKLSNKVQSERFKETARELGVDESGEELRSHSRRR
jgi:hypothetical protein